MPQRAGGKERPLHMYVTPDSSYHWERAGESTRARKVNGIGRGEKKGSFLEGVYISHPNNFFELETKGTACSPPPPPTTSKSIPWPTINIGLVTKKVFLNPFKTAAHTSVVFFSSWEAHYS